MTNSYTLPGRRSVLSGRRPSTAVVWCIRHRRRRLASPMATDRGCAECSGQTCRYCGSLRRFNVTEGESEPPPGVCAADTCIARAEREAEEKTRRDRTRGLRMAR